MRIIKLISAFIILFILSCQQNIEPKRYPILFNMVHHNPGEPKFETQYTEPAFLKGKGYTGQVPKLKSSVPLLMTDGKKMLSH